MKIVYMMKLRFLVLLISTLSLLFLSGCVTILQDLAVAEDGSGTLRFAIGVESEVYPQFAESIPEGYQLENFLAGLMQDEAVIDIEEDQYQADGYTWESILLEISDFSQLFSEERRVGPLIMSLNQAEDIYTFNQSVDMAGSNLEIPGINLMDLAGARYRVRLQTPQIVNTTGVQPSAELSEWEFTMEEFLRGEEALFLQAEYTLEPYEGVFIPWEVFFPYVVIGFLALGGLSIVIVIILNTRKKKEEIPQIKF